MWWCTLRHKRKIPVEDASLRILWKPQEVETIPPRSTGTAQTFVPPSTLSFLPGYHKVVPATTGSKAAFKCFRVQNTYEYINTVLSEVLKVEFACLRSWIHDGEQFFDRQRATCNSSRLWLGSESRKSSANRSDSAKTLFFV